MKAASELNPPEQPLKHYLPHAYAATQAKSEASLSFPEGGEYVTAFEYVNEKHVNLGINTPNGKKEVLVLNTVCMSLECSLESVLTFFQFFFRNHQASCTAGDEVSVGPVV